jgi:DNA-binding winged helix-turn-helix (wHTH) protein/tetratricopeptide (TPR) repeat protein
MAAGRGEPTASFRIDEAGACVWCGERRAELTPKAFAVLRHLAAHQGRLVTKDELLQAVWPDTHVTPAVLKVCVLEIRKALGDTPATPRFIETLPRRGYRFIGAVEPDGHRLPRAESSAAAAGAGLAASAAPPAPVDTARDGRRPPGGLVGREEVLAALQHALDAARHGGRRTVFVTGEAGIGKTSVIDAFVDRVADARRWTARGQCLDHYGQGEAYLPVLEALEHLCRDPARPAFAAELRRRAPTWLAQMPWLMDAADRAALQRTPRGGSRELMLREIAEVIEAFTAERALVLVLEDLHWSDPSTLDLLAFLAQRREPARLLMVGTYRPVDAILTAHPIKALKLELQMHRQCTEQALDYLSAADVAAYLQARLRGALPSGLAEVVHERSSGNPLFMIHVVDHLLAERLLVDTPDGWTLRAAPAAVAATVPEGVRQLIEHQVDHLDERERAVLEAASVAGTEFAASAVAAALGEDVEAVEACAQRLGRQGQFLRPRGPVELRDGAVSEGFEFVHTLQQSVLYQRVPEARRARLHGQIGAWLERAGDVRRGDALAELALHFARGRDHARALVYAERAAARCMALLAFEEAMAHYGAALAALGHATAAEPRRRCDLLIALGVAQALAAHPRQSHETFMEAAALARGLAASEPLALAALGAGDAHQAMGVYDADMVALFEEALQRFPPGDHPLRARLLARLAYGLYAQPGLAARRAALCREALAMARRVGDSDALIWVLQYTTWALWTPRNLVERRAAADEIVRLVEDRGDHVRTLTGHGSRLVFALEAADVDTVDAELERYARLAAATRQPWFSFSVGRFRYMRALLAGQLAEAERLAADSLTEGQRIGHPDVWPLHTGQMAIVRMVQGRFAEVEPALRAAVERSPAVPTWRCALAYACAAQGQRDAAREQLEIVARDDFAAVPEDFLWLAALTFAAETCALLPDARRAGVLERLLEPYADRLIVVSYGASCLGAVARHLGLLAAAQQQEERARARFEQALAIHRRIGARPWLALTLADYADALPRDRRRAAALRREALDIARAVGMQGLVERLDP